MTAPHVEVRDLCITARTPAGERTIVDSVSFAVPRGQVLALIGESGSGKTTIALSLMGYARPGARIAGGSIRVGGLSTGWKTARCAPCAAGASPISRRARRRRSIPAGRS